MDSIESFLSYTLITISDQSVTVGQLLLALLVILVGLLLTSLFNKQLRKRLAGRETSYGLVVLIEGLFLIVMVAVVAFTALTLLGVPVAEILSRIRSFLNFVLITINGQPITVGQVMLVPLVVLLGLYITNRIKKSLLDRLTRRGTDRDLILLIERLYLIVMLAITALIALSLLSVPLTAFAFVSGALAIGIGFGAQNILNNFISGWILMWERPIRIGDFLEIGEVTGRVETINTRSTRIRRVDGVHLLIPNSQLLETTVVNWTLIDRMVRGQVRVGVAYGSPVRRVAELIELAATDHKLVLNDPAPLVLFEDFGDSALIFDLFFWCVAASEKDLRVIKSDMRFTIDDKFAEDGIVIAFPQRDVHIDGELRISRPE